MGFKESVSFLSAIQATGFWLFPRRACPPLNAPAFAGRTFRSSVSLLPAIQTTGLWLLPRRAIPAERASLCWTHVGSRTGAPTVGSGGKSNHFRVGPQSGSHNHVSSPRLLKRSMRFPALRFPACFTSRLCGLFSLRLHVYLSPQVVQFDRRLSHLASASHVVKVVTDSRAASSTGVTRLHRYYQPLRHPLACQPISRCCRLYGLPLLRRFLNGARRASPVA